MESIAIAVIPHDLFPINIGGNKIVSFGGELWYNNIYRL
jgi:hypothetical protein